MARLRQARCYDDPCRDWIDVAVYGKEPRINNSGHYGERIWSSGGSIYSYGTHFEMARVLYEGKGKKRRPVMILVNGERASVTTTKHQGYVRDAVRRSGLPSVIIPFGAIDAANIHIDSIRVLENLTDRQIVTQHESERPPRWMQYVDRAEYRDSEWSEEEMRRWNDWYDWSKHEGLKDELRRKILYGGQAWQKLEAGEEGASEYWLHDLPKNWAELERLEREGPCDLGKPSGYGWQQVYRPHPPKRLEATGFKVQGYINTRHTSVIRGVDATGTDVQGMREGVELHHPDEDGLWRWTTSRHLLGESLIVADVRAMKRTTCTTCNGDGINTTGQQPNLPGHMDWLYPTMEHDFPMPCIRHTVPVPYVGDREDYWDKRRFTTTWNQPVWGALPLPREAYPCRACSGRGWVNTPYLRRNVKFLSGFDHGEPHLAYFFCELPKCDATTVDEAYEALKPDVVKLAEQMGRNVVRQGDIFAVETTATTKDLMAKAKRVGRRNVPKAIDEREIGHNAEAREMRAASMLLGTNHQGTHVIHCKDGTIYAKGCLWHVPDGRTNDHVRQKLGDKWHLIVKNTVPVRRSR